MVFILEIRNDDNKNFSRTHDEIFVQFKVVNEPGNKNSGGGGGGESSDQEHGHVPGQRLLRNGRIKLEENDRVKLLYDSGISSGSDGDTPGNSPVKVTQKVGGKSIHSIKSVDTLKNNNNRNNNNNSNNYNINETNLKNNSSDSLDEDEHLQVESSSVLLESLVEETNNLYNCNENSVELQQRIAEWAKNLIMPQVNGIGSDFDNFILNSNGESDGNYCSNNNSGGLIHETCTSCTDEETLSTCCNIDDEDDDDDDDVNNVDNVQEEKKEEHHHPNNYENGEVKNTNDFDDQVSFADLLFKAVSSTISAKVPAPALLPRTPNVMDLNLYLNRVQQYFNQLGYHRQGEPKIRVNTSMSIKHQIETARALIKAGEAIKCLHALVLSIHFTNCSNHIERFPINFKSEFNGKEYKHVVLGVYLYGMFGALGISRDPGLQDKPAVYPRLIDLIADYHKAYTDSGHYVIEVKIGGIVTHDPHSLELINWKLGVVSMDLDPSFIELTFEKLSKQLRTKMGSTCLRNIRPAQVLPTEFTLTHQLTKESVTPPVAVTSNRPNPVTNTKKSKTMSVTHVAASPSTTTPTNKVRSKKPQVKPVLKT